MPEQPKDRDFVVLPRDALYEFFGAVALPPWKDADGQLIGTGVDAAPIGNRITNWVEEHDLAELYFGGIQLTINDASEEE